MIPARVIVGPVAKTLAATALALVLTSPSNGALPACMDVRTESRYVPFGYNHVVILTNGCSRAAACVVSTDVNPTPIPTVVAAGATTEVLTFMAAPGPAFVAQVSCELMGKSP